MTADHALIAFAAAAALLTITPGLDTALVLRTAVVEGRRRAMLVGAGVCMGCLAWGFAASVGIGVLFSFSRVGYNVLRIAGACYLIYLGGRMFRTAGASFVELSNSAPQASESRRPNWLLRGFLTNILNPKVGVFYVTLLPQFVPSTVHPASFSMLLAAIHASEGLIWFALLTLATSIFAKWLRRPRVAKALDRATGSVLVGAGFALVLHER